MGESEHMSQCMHVQDHTYANKSRRLNVRNIQQLLNPAVEHIVYIVAELVIVPKPIAKVFSSFDYTH